MNAIIAVCSFCELHGPSVLFCTQAFREDTKEFHLGKCDKCPVDCNKRQKKEWYGPSYFSNKARLQGKEANIMPQKSNKCDGCTSTSSKECGFISNDHDARVSYVSSQYPLHPDLFSIVRQACVRSLSCEVCPGREGPIYFGDMHRGHVLSHTFFLKDIQARGLQSWYSIIIVMTDKIFLLNSWPFLVKHFQNVIQSLQEKALKVFNAEQSEPGQHTTRLSSVSRTTFGMFRRLRGNVNARSLIELTNNKNVFAELHLWFTWILKAGAERIIEKFFEGFPNENIIFDLEKEEETEEGFVKICLKKSADEDEPVLSNGPSNDDYKLDDDDMASDDNDDDDDSDMPAHGIWFHSLRELYKTIGYEKFHCLAYHTVVGNQVIIKSRYLSLMKSIIRCLKGLLPLGCYHPIYYSVTYEDSYKCNFLGILPDVNIPDHVDSSELHVQINVTRKDDDDEDYTSVNDFDFVFHTTAQIPEKVPQVLVRMERTIMDDSFPEPVIESFLTTQKEVWMNKVKMLFTFSRSKQCSFQESKQFLQILDASENDKLLMKFWMNGLSSQYKKKTLSPS